MIRIIGLVGGAGAGKSTVAEYLVKHYGARRYAFADPLKEFCLLAHPTFPREAFYGTQAEKEFADEFRPSGRNVMQRLGQAAREAFGEDFWVERLLDRIRRDRPQIAVIEDVRYRNEGRAVKGVADRGDFSWTGGLWRLDPPDRPTSTDASHPSEAEWPKIPVDYVICPDRRDLDLLYQLVRRAAAFFSLTGTESCV